MTDVAQTEIHPETLKSLKEILPSLEEIVAEVDVAVEPGTAELMHAAVRKVADEMRKNFPGLDDLTLAAIAAWSAEKAHGLYHLYGHPSWEKETMAAALVAVDLAWSIRGEGA